MGTIVKRGPMQWQAKIRKQGQHALSKTFTRKDLAEAWMREAELRIERGEIDQLDRATQRITVVNVLAEYREKKLPTFARGGRDHISRLSRIEDRFGPRFVASLRSPEISEWAASITAEGLTGQTVAHHLNSLSSLIEFARRHLGVHLPENPVRLAIRPKLERSRDRRLTSIEYEYLLKASLMSGSGLRQIIVLAIETSMRLGELLGLEWSRIDLQKQVAHLAKTKNGESRTVALSIAAIAALQSLPRRIDGRVFGWAKADSFEKLWQRCKARAKVIYRETNADAPCPPGFLEDLRFHDLRHEATSRLFEKGLGIMEVASMTGHKSLTMLKKYTHMDAQRLALKLG